MIREDDAREIAIRFLARDDITLEGFSHGWRIRLPEDEHRRGLGTFVVEHETGALLQFPSAVPPRRVLSSFLELRDRGMQLDPDSGQPIGDREG